MTDTLTILSAQFNNPEHTGAVVMTTERAAVMVSERDRPELWAQLLIWQKAGGRIAAYVAPLEPTDARTPEQKLAATGLTVDDLKQLLGIDAAH